VSHTTFADNPISSAGSAKAKLAVIARAAAAVRKIPNVFNRLGTNA
jgi:hypothetical protein